ncbi:MAG: Gfo/Idh/MocA family oxidoreductase [Chromatiales bacterium]|jgi:predicted dehydrogenase|nr:Gfo/Idh/MocA family oxidoreductase [Chromatiales bacterium]
MPKLHTLGFFEPGHFHAALTLKTSNPRISSDVHLYATPGSDRDAFVALIEAFNARAQEPTAWRLHIHDVQDPLAALIDDSHVDIVVLAGRNASKLQTMAALHNAGIAVLADKPWLTDPASLAHLERVTTGLPLVLDIMTERHDTLARLRATVVVTPSVFGEFSRHDPDGPAIEIGSTHHLFKRVNGVPLIRPTWYYDVGVQGDGLVDIQSHMVDQVQWLCDDGTTFDIDTDVNALQAKRWGTAVPVDLFRDSTGADEFPGATLGDVTGTVLDLQCNGTIRCAMRGVPVALRAEWRQREPENGGDIHAAHLRGTRAELILEHGPHTGFDKRLHLKPRPGIELEPTLSEVVREWQDSFPGLTVRPSQIGYELVLPMDLQTTHEQLFAMVLNDFLDRFESGQWSAPLGARIRMRYALLARAKRLVDEATQ